MLRGVGATGRDRLGIMRPGLDLGKETCVSKFKGKNGEQKLNEPKCRHPTQNNSGTEKVGIRCWRSWGGQNLLLSRQFPGNLISRPQCRSILCEPRLNADALCPVNRTLSGDSPVVARGARGHEAKGFWVCPPPQCSATGLVPTRLRRAARRAATVAT